ncbi:Anhydro-N-acetylmuramic acid kinase [Pseudoalteromonas luteoviolacea B = ATCC 29581]|nr:Anhydro-N-acetylmuramic acid kinase [Pseudoalteromonas luteoviolacea B = ATCC 29581]
MATQQTVFEQLASMSAAKSRRILGLMSGTSMDGLDIALCEISGRGTATQCKVLNYTTVAYPEEVKQKIRPVFSQSAVDLDYLTLLNGWLGNYYAELVNQTLETWEVAKHDVDIVASHGQTIFHCPAHQHQYDAFTNGTLQIGDGDHLAVKTGIVTMSDFRQKHVAAGGEGAPLAVYGDYCLFASDNETRVLLNLGGIANITALPKGEGLSNVVCSDIGPANTMIDAYVRTYFNVPYDSNGSIAASGQCNEALLNALMTNRFISKAMPKSTGPEVFNLDWLIHAQTMSGTYNLDKRSVVTTLTHFSAMVIAKHINEIVKEDKVALFASGGGVSNPVLCELIQTQLSPMVVWNTTESLGVDPDAKEAVLFALLANEAITQPIGLETNLHTLTMGKLSLPR